MTSKKSTPRPSGAGDVDGAKGANPSNQALTTRAVAAAAAQPPAPLRRRRTEYRPCQSPPWGEP
jgi:hypothetical protein